MDFEKFKQRISAGDLKAVYLFYGEADFLKEEALKFYENYLLDKTSGNLAVEAINNDIGLDELVEQANTLPLFYSNKLLVLKDVNYFSGKKSDNGKRADNKIGEKMFLKYLDDPNPTSFIVLISEGKPDSRKSIFKALQSKDMIVEFNQLKGRNLLKWAYNRFTAYEKKIEAEALDYLVTCVGNDLALLDQEISKLVLFTGEGQKEITLDIVEEMVSKTAQVTIFNLVDAVAEGRGVEAVKYCHELLKQGEKEFFISYMLARQFRLILEAKLLIAKGYNQGQLPQIMQTQMFAIKKALKQGNKFSLEQLVAIMDKLLSLDLAIKTGQGEPRLLLETTIAELSS